MPAGNWSLIGAEVERDQLAPVESQWTRGCTRQKKKKGLDGGAGVWEYKKKKKKKQWASIDKVRWGTLSPQQDNFSESCNYVADISCAIL